ncbi:triose-phosphate isomerase [Desulfospira joergensenii]|uniref:triose-phosphate isomerase n=1 Tax=Desulfospira joergensenii TaxID=53329 RepID=UPI0003B3A8E4|nr:triose-phosphate isomerase [Desulfospira joergensenii]
MSRIPLIAGNWKMYKTGPEAVETGAHLASLSSDVSDVEIMIAPTHLSLALVSHALKGTRVKTGAQNLFHEDEGAFTGEVSAKMIKSAGAEYAIIGHSERRQYFQETDQSVCKKVQAAVAGGLKPILCIGETETQRDQGKTFFILDKQVSDGLKASGPGDLEDLVLAYEPVWAIGTGRTASVEQVEEVHRHLRSKISTLFSNELADRTRILYGGSVKPDNVSDLMSIEDVDGALVGGASLDADQFIKIINFNK